MKAYYAKSTTKNKKFLYVVINPDDDGYQTLSNSETHHHSQLHDNTSPEVHLTVNSAFDRYVSKRLAIPHIVKLYSNMIELGEELAKHGYVL